MLASSCCVLRTLTMHFRVKSAGGMASRERICMWVCQAKARDRVGNSKRIVVNYTNTSTAVTSTTTTTCPPQQQQQQRQNSWKQRVVGWSSLCVLYSVRWRVDDSLLIKRNLCWTVTEKLEFFEDERTNYTNETAPAAAIKGGCAVGIRPYGCVVADSVSIVWMQLLLFCIHTDRESLHGNGLNYAEI